MPYIPTAKERKLGNFWRYAAMPATMMAISAVTTVVVIYMRLYHLPESHVRMTTEANWAMIGFLIVNSIFMSGRLWAAWQDRVRPEPEDCLLSDCI